MRGPAIFLLSLVGVALVGIFVVRPVKVERDRLAVDILERADGLPAPRPQRPSDCVIDLAEEIGLTRGPDRTMDLAQRLALDFTAIDRIEIADRELSFPMAWSDVPRLLRCLAEKKGLHIQRFEARPREGVGEGEAPDRCEITLEFAPSITGFGVR